MDYKLCGVVKIISKDKQERLGYQNKIKNKIVLKYRLRRSSSVELYYYRVNDKPSSEYNILYDYMVDETYTLDEARDKFPELFL